MFTNKFQEDRYADMFAAPHGHLTMEELRRRREQAERVAAVEHPEVGPRRLLRLAPPERAVIAQRETPKQAANRRHALAGTITGNKRENPSRAA